MACQQSFSFNSFYCLQLEIYRGNQICNSIIQKQQSESGGGETGGEDGRSAVKFTSNSWKPLFETCTAEFFTNFPRYIQVICLTCDYMFFLIV